MVTKKLMDSVYEKIPGYNSKQASGFVAKLPHILSWAADTSGKILDAGCGAGDNMRAIAKAGRDVYGIDFSSVCCKLYLSGLKHKAIDIKSYCDSLKKPYGGILCAGVLEHIEPEDLDGLLQSMSTASKSFLFGIANHSDILNGDELHLIVEDQDWWIKKLKDYFDSVMLSEIMYKGKFFFIRCAINVEEGQPKKKGAKKNEPEDAKDQTQSGERPPQEG